MDKNDDLSHLISKLDQENGESPGARDGESAEFREAGPEGERASPPASSDEQADQFVAKVKEVEEWRDKYLRLAAEFENYKRLALKDQREHVRFANEHLLKELLPALDNLERAIGSAREGAGGDALLQGVELTLKQALEVLGRFGVSQMSTEGELFDPTRHQAVARVESSDIPEHGVVKEYQRGYLLHDRVLRAAMVSVAAPPAAPPSEQAAGCGQEEGQDQLTGGSAGEPTEAQP